MPFSFRKLFQAPEFRVFVAVAFTGLVIWPMASSLTRSHAGFFAIYYYVLWLILCGFLFLFRNSGEPGEPREHDS